jgi:ATP-binding cassette subfamily B protein
LGEFGLLYIAPRFDGQARLRICQHARGSLLRDHVSNIMVRRMSSVEVRENTSKSQAVALPLNGAPIAESLPKQEPEAAEPVMTGNAAPAPGARGARLRPLLALMPYIARYRGRALLALVALVVAALTTLVVPLAVRRIIDFGFTSEGVAMINNYFSMMIGVVAVLAGASAARYFLVTTTGERIVSDLRRDVFAHIISLSPVFFDSARSG